MAVDPRTNFAISTVATAPVPASSGTSLTLAAAGGALFPATANGSYNLVVWPTGVLANAANAEIIRVTTRTGDALNPIVRQQEGTAARTIIVGDQVALVPTAATFAQIIDYVNAAPSAYAPSGLLNLYDRARGIYNWKGTNTRLLDGAASTAMTGSPGVPGSGQGVHLFFGDSGAAGCWTSVGVTAFDRLRAMPLVFRDQLALLGIPANGTGFIRVVDGTVIQIDSRWSTTGVWVNNGSCASTVTVSTSATCAPDRDGTIWDQWYDDSKAGTFTVSVGGAVSGPGFATVVCSGAGTWKKVRLSGVTITAGVTTIKVTCTVVNTTGIQISGGECFSPDGGLRMQNVSQSGAWASGTGTKNWQDISTATALGAVYKDVGGLTRTVTDFSSTSASTTLTSAGTANFTTNDVGEPVDLTPGASGVMFPPGSYIAAFISSTQVTMSNAAVATLSGQTGRIGRPPGCIHIELGLNDLMNGVSNATTTAAITTIRNRYPNSDCLLHLVDEVSPSLVAPATMLAFQQAMFNLADTLDVPLVDWRDRTGTYAAGQASGDYGDNLVHLAPSTYADIGASIGTTHGGGSATPQSWNTPKKAGDLSNKRYVDGLGSYTRPIVADVVTSGTTEQLLYQLVIPASFWAAGGGVVEITGTGEITGTTPTILPRIRCGTAGTTADTAVCAPAAASAAFTTGDGWVIQAQLTCRTVGASGTIFGKITLLGNGLAVLISKDTASVTVNTTVKNFLTLFVTPGGTTPVVTCNQAYSNTPAH